MEITFAIPYRTQWGEMLQVAVKDHADGQTWDIALDTQDGYWWTGTFRLPSRPEDLQYEYRVTDATGRILRRESGIPRHFLPERRKKAVLCDAWMDCPDMTVFARSALADCACRRKGSIEVRTDLLEDRSLLLLRALPPAEGWRWGVLGSSKALGRWQPENVRLMQRTGVYEWGLPLGAEELHPDTCYKYVWVPENSQTELLWESGDNRCLCPEAVFYATPAGQGEAAWIHTDHFPIMDGVEQRWRGAGVVVTVFSLRSEGSFGVGDFGDLRAFVEWAGQTGMRAVQLLPVNDTSTTGGPRDSYPYSAISVFALHPIYFDPRWASDSKAYARHEARGRELNAMETLDYTEVWKLKMAFLRDLYAERGASVRRTSAYKSFCKENGRWLCAWSDFCARRDTYHTADFRQWPGEGTGGWTTATPAGAATETALQKLRDFYQFVQYLLHLQLSGVHDTARAHGVILKGDIPIGICRDSVPAREDTPLFHFEGSAGAPPDAFATQGQNWGFPTYDWERMSRDGYAWWRERLRHFSQYFDAYRIDHVLGFFRIWEIPVCQVYGTLGHFRPALPMTTGEIRDFGFSAPVERYARPLLNEEQVQHLRTLCAREGQYVETYVHRDECGDWRLLEEWLHQRTIQERVWNEELRNALMDAVAEVLFIEDRERPGTWHPRVCGNLSAVYAGLGEGDRMAFDRIHEHFYYERHNAFWAAEAMRKIPAVINYAEASQPASSDCEGWGGTPGGMLPCAEDLGMIPASVKGVLETLKILSLEIQRMPKEWGVRFGNPAHYPYMSVATPGTHDMSPFRLWWKESAEQTQAYWHEVLGREGDAPEEAPADACEQMVSQHLASPSMLCLIALQDYLAMDTKLRHPHPEAEQINNPADPHHYWQYRMHITLEQLCNATPFNEKLRALIKRSGRGSGTL